MSNHFNGEHFYNPVDHKDKSLWDVLKWQWTRVSKDWPKTLQNEVTPQLPQKLNKGQFALTFINHASFLVQVQTSQKMINILTDPVFSERTSPLSFIGPKRVRPPGIEIDKLPPIDIVLISHNHYDHMDFESLKILNEKFSPLFIVPLENAHYLKFSKKPRIQEKDWNEFVDLPEWGLKVHVLRAHHWSRRSLTDTNKALWCSFMIETKDNTIYFAGDTGYKDHFREIKSKFPKISLALLPIGAYEPRWFMKDAHMNPDDAIKAHIDLSPTLSVGIHFGTFPLTDEGIDDPVLDLEKAKSVEKIDNFIVLKEGQTGIYQN
ncbi:MAG: MBL fold metallo-hydrolase [Bdellovibrionaceae bacterium]|nr:MBL fold metallo-hydrolase [Pseudobdellovibrionaceae bacterium]